MHVVRVALELLEVVQTSRKARGPHVTASTARDLHTFSPVKVDAHKLVVSDLHRIQGSQFGVGSMAPLLMSVMGFPRLGPLTLAFGIVRILTVHPGGRVPLSSHRSSELGVFRFALNAPNRAT